MANEVNIDKSQAQMDDQFVREYMEAVGPGGNLDEFLVDWGMSENDVIDYLESNPQLLPEGFEPHYEGSVPEDGDDRTDEEIEMGDPDSYNDFIPDYSKTAEYEGEGITSELIPGESMAADTITWLAEKAGLPPEAALVMAGIVGKNPKNIKKATEGMFTPRKNKGNLKTDKRGTKSGKLIGDVKKGGPGTTVGKPGPASQMPSKHVKYPIAKTPKETKRLGLTRKNEKIAAGGLTTGLVLNRMLQGDRDVDGTLKVAPKPVTVAPEEEIQGNQFGYHKREGQNFWTVNNEDPYWDTHEMGTGDAWSDADVKEVVQEVDWSGWFNR